MRNQVDFCSQINIRVSFKWFYCFWWPWSGMPDVPKITSLQYLCNISGKRWGINTIFCMTMSKVFYKLVVSFLLVKTSHAQSRSVTYLQYLKKEVRDEVDFLCRWASKLSINWYWDFLWVWPGMPKVLIITSLYCLSVSQEKIELLSWCFAWW